MILFVRTVLLLVPSVMLILIALNANYHSLYSAETALVSLSALVNPYKTK